MERHELSRLLARSAGTAASSGPLIAESDPRRFMATVAGAFSGDGNIFLGNPAWTTKEHSDAISFIGREKAEERGWLMIPTGGSSGKIKFARHDGSTLSAAVQGFRSHFGMDRVNAISVLPLHHVGGFMSWMRSALTGGSFVPWAWKDLEAGNYPKEIPPHCCLSLVPTQLQRLLASEASIGWLRRFGVIFVGGGPAWDGLIETAAALGLPLSPGYGATETAAMVAALKPQQFLNGMRGCGTALPHARVDIDQGMIRVRGESIFRGYYPGVDESGSWATEDTGHIDAEGSLVVEGRRDDVVITGGKKVAPAEVEEALRSSGAFEDVAVIGLPDPDWGQAVVACHPPTIEVPGKATLAAALSGLAAFKHPKRYISVSPWPRNAQGKIDRSEMTRLAALSPQATTQGS